MKTRIIKLTTVYLVLFLSIIAPAQSGGTFEITQSVIGGGGGQQSAGGMFSLDGTIGQPAAGGHLNGAGFSLSSGFWNPDLSGGGLGMEGDVAGRPNGDGEIQANDVIQMRRFFNELDLPATSPNEFQRADSAPRLSRGDGNIDATDIIQTLRYLNELDALQSAGGQIAPSGGKPSSSAESALSDKSKTSAPQVAPELRVESTSGSAGNPVTVNIRVDAVGNESQYGFAVLFDPNVLSYANFAAGETGAATFSCNTTATPGRIRCDVGGFPNDQPGSSTPVIKEIAAGNDQLLIKVIFNVAANAVANTTTAVRLGSASASDDAANSISPATTNGTVTITGATAAGATVSGRVMTQTGRGIVNVQITMTDRQGRQRRAVSTAFGNFRFTDVAAGETYIFTVKAKRFIFTPDSQVRLISENVADLVFFADN